MSARKNQDIQVLRALAVGFVMVQHLVGFLPTPAWFARLPDWFALWSGVDLFFGISGFVITRSIMDSSAVVGGFRLSRDGFRRFWIRRAWRIFPAAWLWALIPLALSFFVIHVPGMQPHLVAQSSLAGIFAYANFYLAGCSEHATTTLYVTCPNLFAGAFFWSLSREEQFYLTLSVLLLVLRFRTLLWIGLAAAAAYAFVAKPPLLFAWNMRFEALVLGMACYAFTRTPAYAASARWLRSFAVRFVLLMALLLVIATAGVWSPLYGTAWMAVASAIALWVASFESTLSRGAPGRWLAAMGDRSYALYLAHMPMYLLAVELLRRAAFAEPFWTSNLGWAIGSALAVGLTFTAAEVTYRWVDRPLTERGRRIAGRSPASAAPAAGGAQLGPGGLEQGRGQSRGDA